MKISAGLVRETIRIKFFLEKNNVSFHIQGQKKKIKLKVELKKQSQISGKQSYLKRLIKLTILWLNCSRQKKKKKKERKHKLSVSGMKERKDILSNPTNI